MVRRHIEICDGETYIKTSLSIWAFSSVGYSNRLITGRSRVRVPEGPPTKKPNVSKTKKQYRGIAQLVEQRSPKPRAEGSIPSAPAIWPGSSVG